MRLTTARTASGTRVGVLDGDAVRLLEVIGGGAEALADVARRARSGEAIDLGSVAFAPLLDPPSVRDFLTYEQHLAELAGHVPDAWYEKPLFYFSNPAAIVGPYDEVPIPPLVTQYDYELEIAAVVGLAGADLTPEQARRHILGYTIMNDWSARDLQVHEFEFPMGPSKSKDGAITLGPWLVTADELADHVEDDRLALTTTVWLNGVRVGSRLAAGGRCGPHRGGPARDDREHPDSRTGAGHRSPRSAPNSGHRTRGRRPIGSTSEYTPVKLDNAVTAITGAGSGIG